jgi:hypothetical protein
MEIKQTLSITLPVSLYQQLCQEVGKGNISKFIRETVEEKLIKEKKTLGQAYHECYSKNPHLLNLSRQWEQAQNDDWLTWERSEKTKTKKK